MKITCEHCGCIIDTDKDKKCPNCGAPYSKSEEYKEVKDYHKKNKDYDLKEREEDIKTKELTNKVFQNALFGSKMIAIVASMIFLIIVIVFISIAFSTKKSTNSKNEINHQEQKEIIDKIQDQMGLKEQEKITVSFNELAETENYEIKCNKVSEYKYDYFEQKEYKKSDYKVYNFQIIFTNKKEIISTLNNIQLTYTDKEGNENIVAKKVNANVDESKNALDFLAKDTLTHKGNMAYEIPKYVNDVKIVYDSVTIVIDNFKGKM